MAPKFKEIPLILDGLSLEHHVKGLTDSEKRAWYKGFSKSVVLTQQAFDRIRGVFKLPDHSMDFHEELMSKLIEINQSPEVDASPNKSTDELYLLKTSGFVGNSLLWWRQGCAGYTTDIDKAHRFMKEEAEKIVNSSQGENEMYPLSIIERVATRQIHTDHLYEATRKEASNG